AVVVPGLCLRGAFCVGAAFRPRTGDLAPASASAPVGHALGRSSRPGRGGKGALSGVADTTADSTPAHDRATASAGATGQSASAAGSDGGSVATATATLEPGADSQAAAAAAGTEIRTTRAPAAEIGRALWRAGHG